MNPEVQKYMQQFPESVQESMMELRELILSEVPNLEEKIAYGMPGFYYMGKPFVYFGGFKNHLGFYATPDVHEDEQLFKELSKYKQGRGSIQFPYKDGLPLDLIKKMIQLKKKKQDLKL